MEGSNLPALVDAFLSALPTVGVARQIEVFRDVQSLRTGELWDQALIEAVFKTRAMLVFVSSDYVSSPLCMFEMMLFMNRGLVEKIIRDEQGNELLQSAVIPLRTEECVLPMHLARLHAPIITSTTLKQKDFLTKMRRQIIITIGEMSSVAMEYGGGDSLHSPYIDFKNIGRDLSPLRDVPSLQEAAKTIIRRCEDLFKELPKNRPEGWALQQIMGQTIAFLNR